ncbi:hypothetical protein [Streptomyces sp. NPDC056983]|uniref:hypothetical protein n=1 Tax=Streptomyces sp. NPDC056983 TaxID=3345987 RepID=UPI003633CA09
MRQRSLARALSAVAAGHPAAVAQVVDGPPELLGRTVSVLGDDCTYDDRATYENTGAYDGSLGGEREDRAVTTQAPTHTSRRAVPASSTQAGTPTAAPRASPLNAEHPRMLIFVAVGKAEACGSRGEPGVKCRP